MECFRIPEKRAKDFLENPDNGAHVAPPNPPRGPRNRGAPMAKKKVDAGNGKRRKERAAPV
ncbi:MAG TPA: hypothetical protein VE028_14700, partial [Nitratidesulfovibrio sp.]|nr:hypothetical protein [Nitratidesulfovibrio sp.]